MASAITISPESREVIIELEKTAENITTGTRRGLLFVGRQLYKTAHKGMKRGRRTGRAYRYKGRILISSAPNEWPQRRSGKLRDGLNFKVLNDRELEFGDNADHGKWVEIKKKNRGGRPYLIRSIRENEKKILNIMEDNINKELGI